MWAPYIEIVNLQSIQNCVSRGELGGKSTWPGAYGSPMPIFFPQHAELIALWHAPVSPVQASD